METSQCQLFLLHFAGGNRYSFQFLKEIAPGNVDFHALELPGRGSRMREKLLVSQGDAVADYVSQIKRLRKDMPYIVFGHSMGATLGLQVVKELEKSNDPPRTFIASGNAGPGTGARKMRYLMDNDSFKEELRLMGGIPAEILNSEEMFEFFGPLLRADFEMLEKEALTGEELKISTPLLALMGDQEEFAHEIENWKEYTEEFVGKKILPGNHFFIHSHANELMQIILSCYDRTLVH
jgi:surfactin synthase thioesterase subunit